MKRLIRKARPEIEWGSIGNNNEQQTAPFMRVENGINQIRIIGKPYQVSIHWENALDGTMRRIICPGTNCPLCKKGKFPMQRFQVQVINRKTNNLEILEAGTSLFSQIKNYATDPDYGDPTTYDFKIKKEGSGRSTQYTVIASPKKSNLTNEEITMVDGVKSLSETNKPKTLEELYTMGLQTLDGSIVEVEDDVEKTKKKEELEINDDDWDNL